MQLNYQKNIGSKKIVEITMKKAFTLIEILIVVVILAIIVAILAPVLSKAEVSAKKIGAVSNCQQQLLAQSLYMQDDDNRYPMLELKPEPDVNGDPVRYFWPQLITPYIDAQAIGRGFEGIMRIDDLPKIFFDPVKSFKSQTTEDLHFGRFTSWGYSNELSRIVSRFYATNIGVPLYGSSVFAPYQTVDLAETNDWLSQGGFPGDCQAPTYFDVPNVSLPIPEGDLVRDSVDAPYPSGHPRLVPTNPLDISGLNVVGFCDGHVKLIPVVELISSGQFWSTQADGQSNRPL